MRKIFLLILLALSVYALWPRFNAEIQNNNVAIVADFREIHQLASVYGVNLYETIKNLIQNGLTGLMIGDITGDQAERNIGYAKLFPDDNGTKILIPENNPNKNLLDELIKIRFPSAKYDKSDNTFLINMTIPMLKTVGIIPDIEALEFAKNFNLPIYYRTAPAPGTLDQGVADSLKKIHELYKINLTSPAGEIVAGFPDVSNLANTIKNLNIPVAMPEFNRQRGAIQFNNLTAPNLIPLHSVTNDEILARNISRPVLTDRLIRAAVERSVRVLLVHTAPQNTGNFSAETFANEIKNLSDGLKNHGFNISWPEIVKINSSFNIFSSLALAGILVYSVWKYLLRLGVKNNFKFDLAFIFLGLILSGAILKFSFIARLAGGLATGFIATEAALLSMELNKKFNIFASFIFAVIGGLCVASFFSVPNYILRLQTFSGVKLTILLPPILVLIHDLQNKIHPEGIKDFIKRPPLWGELILCGILLIAVGLILFRSDNVSFIPGFEAKIRTTLEKILIARPRSREVFIGYPCLILLGYFVNKNYLPKLRELLRLGVVLGFSSVINSFCHFHTPLHLILLREFNGLWTGLLLGIVLLLAVKFIIIPVLKFLRPFIA